MIRVLYIESSVGGVGGSLVSLWTLVSHLDRARFAPEVLIFEDHAFWDRFRDRGIEVTVWSLPAWRRRLRTGRMAVPKVPGPSGETVATGDAAGAWTVPVSTAYLRQPAARRAAGSAARLLLEDLPLARRLAGHAEQRGIHILHANDRVGSNRFVALAGWLSGRPVVQHERLAAPYRWTDCLASRCLSATFCVSEAIRSLARKGGHRGPNMIVLPNAVAAPAAVPVTRNGHTRVGIAGRLVPWKGQDLFLDAMARVARIHQETRFVIMGAGPEGGSAFADCLRAKAATPPLDGRVEFTGYLRDPWPVLASLDVLVLATRTAEPFGRTLIEAMSVGVPVVAPAAGGPLDIVEDGVTGLLYPRNDAPALAASVSRLLSDRSLIERMGRAGRMAVATRFEPSANARAVEAVYDRLLPVEV